MNCFKYHNKYFYVVKITKEIINKNLFKILLFIGIFLIVISSTSTFVSDFSDGKSVSAHPIVTKHDVNKGVSCTYNDNMDVPILAYHEIVPDDQIGNYISNLAVTPEEFENQIAYLKNVGYHSISYEELYEFMVNKKPIPEKSIVISFDDGYLSNYKYLPEILKKYEMKAEIAVIPGFMEQKSDSIVNGLQYFNWVCARLMENSGYIDIVSHSLTHADLTKTTDLLKELNESKKIINKNLDINTNVIVYPCGKYNDEVIKEANDCGYVLGVTLKSGINRPRDNPMEVKRLIVNHGESGEEIVKVIERYELKH